MLTDIHFILTYTCNFECDHCFLYCSPNSMGTFTLSQIKDVLAECKKMGTIKTIGLEGGEPFLFHPLVLAAVKMARESGYKTAIQTNCYWATAIEDAGLWLEPLDKAGLDYLEVSDDTFHHEDESENPAKRARAAAEELTMKVNSICINPPQVEDDHDQEKGEPIYRGGPKMRGRAVEKLIPGLPTKSWDTFHECPFEDLRNPKRVHIDAFGTVHLCQGLSMGNMWETPLSELVENYDPDNHPVCGPLLAGGPTRLAQEYNVAHQDEYVDACHLCTHSCLALIDRFPQYLTPRQVYGLE